METNDQIHRLINDADTHIKRVIEHNENEFLTAFEQNMFSIQKDMKNLKDKVNV